MSNKRVNSEAPEDQPHAKKPRLSSAAFVETILAFPENALPSLQPDLLVKHLTELQLAHHELRTRVEKAKIPATKLELPEDSPFVETILALPEIIFQVLSKAILSSQIVALRTAHKDLRDILQENGLDPDKPIDLADLRKSDRLEVASLVDMVKIGIRKDVMSAISVSSVTLLPTQQIRYKFDGFFPSLSVLMMTFGIKEGRQVVEKENDKFEATFHDILDVRDLTNVDIRYMRTYGDIKISYGLKRQNFSVTGKVLVMSK